MNVVVASILLTALIPFRGAAAVLRDVIVQDGLFINTATNSSESLLGTNVVVKGSPWLPSVGGSTSCKDLEDSETICTTWNEHDIKAMKESGLNMIRLSVVWAGGQPSEVNELDADFKGRLDAILNLAHSNDIRVILDLHQDAISTATCGEGVPMWYVKKHLPNLVGVPVIGIKSSLTGECSITDLKSWQEYAGDPEYNIKNKCCVSINTPGPWGEQTIPTVGVQTVFAHLVGTEVGRSAYSNYVKLLTSFVQLYPAVVGFELMNEPPFFGGIKFETDWLYELYKESYEAIRSIDPTIAVGLSDYGSVAKYPDDSHIPSASLRTWIKSATNLIYTFHWYSSGFGDFDEAVENAHSLSELWNAAPVMTEFSYDEGRLDKLAEFGINWAYYQWDSYCSVPKGVEKNSTCEVGDECQFGACIT
ncbi:hypothetical protein TrVE_jg11758 [Triparma verrucosa]|uniref:Glycoside hydrolase family 5 domain-containing protein n=1 Tax=Triparma verrucosa TaxID=1606542 RepID=A0A9W7CNQ3_9STRA|nr:hypothetical protein TrVE_jg11758 [Triparma verrucosa]